MRTLPRNDPRQYDDLVAHWSAPAGPFAPLYWLAEARARLVPPAPRPGALLVDVGCGGGLLAPYLAGKGYRHLGVDLMESCARASRERGVHPLRGDAAALPLAAGAADVVVAGEILEHVPDLGRAVAELCRVLRPGGRLVLDTLNATRLSRLLIVTLGERVPGVPRGLHDPGLFVPVRRLVDECAAHGVKLRVRGIRPTAGGLLRWLRHRYRVATGPGDAPPPARIVPTWSTAVCYQGWGSKDGTRGHGAGEGEADGGT
ncbi:methyltransferase domain-containing protein [Rhizomonospora bruguierae]|uniref:methyltransferase domain-containing protein n=1 Tax=Rhizomonospora bruguierae TaxID=1581705 RepID=UPI001BCF3BF6|nr:methyltransferase domain-containing protein [Micromonospora sp. NBRC 107566]